MVTMQDAISLARKVAASTPGGILRRAAAKFLDDAGHEVPEEKRRVTQVEQIAADAKRTGVVNFGGEFSFLITDTLEEALAKLFECGCDIGGYACKSGDHFIKVTECYGRGYWEFEWFDNQQGVYRIRHWTDDCAPIGAEA